ncbi:hypothetical protein, partial [Thiomonas arsenitoxydans]|uniref:hypothetical protein n=1 Tax=Thiomonas arsenitoxydans (strain DSM 22701 / CIP 110005 / 3As) TaxID=426114 RepID=UPI001CA45AE5
LATPANHRVIPPRPSPPQQQANVVSSAAQYRMLLVAQSAIEAIAAQVDYLSRNYVGQTSC